MHEHLTSHHLSTSSSQAPPTAAWTLALIDAGSAVAMAAMATDPLTQHAPVHAFEICSALLVLTAIGTVVLAGRLGQRALLLSACARIGVSVVLAALASTAGGSTLGAAGFIWIALWTVAFFDNRTLFAVLGLEFVGAVVASLANPNHLRTLMATGAAGFAGVLSAGLMVIVLGNLRRQVRCDHLTGLLNRFGVDEELRQLGWRRRASEPVSLVVIDLDGFKAINDREGHLAGDAVLVAFAEQLRHAAPRRALTARVGGDEFLAILPGATAGHAAAWAAGVRSASEVDWSFGVAQRQVNEPLAPWLARADKLMYAAKGRRRTDSRGTAPVGILHVVAG